MTQTTTQKKKQVINQVIDLINAMDNYDLVTLNNEYCQAANYHDSEIFANDEDFFQTFFEIDTLKAIQATQFGDYRYHDNWVTFNGYGNLDSFNWVIDNLCELVPTMAAYIVESHEDFSQFDEIDFNNIED
jgi:hypothetical protein